ncbi:MAG: flagellar hook assembly protein FlgD [bacterium]
MTSSEPITHAPPQNFFGSSNNILGKDDFLRLLVTQLRHQDPLNPMKSEDFAAQLAQFSSVEQLQNINTSLSNSIETDMLLNQSINNMMATTLIGKEVQALGNQVTVVEGQPVDLNFRLFSAAENVTITINDSNGVPVRTIELDGRVVGEHAFTWDGKDNAGDLQPDGEYTFSVSARNLDGNSITAQTFITGLISSVRYENGNAILRIGDRDVQMADVFQIGDSEFE